MKQLADVARTGKVVTNNELNFVLSVVVHGINPKLPGKSTVMVKVDKIYNAMWGPAAGKQIA